jgi:hypothetical protein
VLDGVLNVRDDDFVLWRRLGAFGALRPGFHLVGLLPCDELVVTRAGTAEGAAGQLERVRAIRARQRRWSWLLGACGIYVFGCLAVLLPADLSGRLRLTLDWERLGLALAAAWLVGAAACWLQLRAARADGKTVRSALTSLLFFPPSVAHASTVLGRHLYGGFHPLVVATGVADRDTVHRLARRLRFQAQALGREPALDALLRELQIPVAEVLASPRSSDPTAAVFCPLCATEYRRGFADCTDCGAALQPLAA